MIGWALIREITPTGTWAYRPIPPGGQVKDLVRRSVEEKIESLGFFNPRRKLQQRSIAIPYGASGILMHALRRGTIDAAVVACEGAGSVITDAPEVAMGMWYRILHGLLHRRG